MANASPPYRRRNFFIKHGFQLRFALYPLAFLSVFLMGGGLYAYRSLRSSLEFHLYLPHSRLNDPWELVLPVLVRVIAFGGGAFLLALGVWGWRRFSVLHADLGALAEWARLLARGGAVEPLPRLRDAEVHALGASLHRGASMLAGWDERLAAGAAAIADALAGLERPEELAPGEGLRQVREALQAFRDELSTVRIEEDLG